MRVFKFAACIVFAVAGAGGARAAEDSQTAQTVRLADNGQFVVGFMGRYDDELVKVDGHWLINSRKLVSFIPPAAPQAR